MYMSEKYSPRPLGTSVDLYCEGAGINAPFTVYLQNVIAETEKAIPAERLRKFPLILTLLFLLFFFQNS